MKKLSIALLLFLTVSCRSTITPEKTVVTEVDLITTDKYDHYKYKIYLLTNDGNLDPCFFTNKDYKVGDTIYFSTKP